MSTILHCLYIVKINVKCLAKDKLPIVIYLINVPLASKDFLLTRPA